MLLCGETDSFLSLYAEYTFRATSRTRRRGTPYPWVRWLLPDGTVQRTRIRLMAYPFVRAIIHIDKQRFPVGAKCIIVYRITMILRSDETTFRANHAYRLVVAAMPVFQLVYLAPPALLSNWLPMQIPKIGNLGFCIALRMFCTAASHVSGSPGPLEMKSPSNFR